MQPWGPKEGTAAGTPLRQVRFASVAFLKSLRPVFFLGVNLSQCMAGVFLPRPLGVGVGAGGPWETAGAGRGSSVTPKATPRALRLSGWSPMS